MQRASYLFLFMQSNSRSVSNAKNLPPSTFPLNPEKRPFFRIFCDDKRIVRRRKKEERREGKFYLCKVVTVFGRCAAISFSWLVCESGGKRSFGTTRGGSGCQERDGACDIFLGSFL